jgi:hypothetical protein
MMKIQRPFIDFIKFFDGVRSGKRSHQQGESPLSMAPAALESGGSAESEHFLTTRPASLDSGTGNHYLTTAPADMESGGLAEGETFLTTAPAGFEGGEKNTTISLAETGTETYPTSVLIEIQLNEHA